MSEWIKIEDRLPENMTKVLGWRAGIYNECFVVFHNQGHFHFNEITAYDMPITHWMPLPLPPS